MKKASFILILVLNVLFANAQENISFEGVRAVKYADISYKSRENLSDYEKERCKLDIYAPESAIKKLFLVLIYFHGGGLFEGDKSEGWAEWSNNFGYKFIENEVLIVSVNYRLSGKNNTKWPAYLEDAASAVAWVNNNIAAYGGNNKQIFVSGFSAGAYITHMLSIDNQWLAKAGVDKGKIKGYIPISGQTRVHGTVAKDLGVSQDSLMIVKPFAMPLGNVKKVDKPIYIFVGEKEGNTITDNQTYYKALLNRGSKQVYFFIQPNKDHGGIRDGLGDGMNETRTKILDFIRKYK